MIIRKMKIDYPNAVITREFHKGQNILVRVVEITNISNEKSKVTQKEKEIDDWYIRQIGGR